MTGAKPDLGRFRSFGLNLANYVKTRKRLGFTDEDVAKSGSDRLVVGALAELAGPLGLR